MKLQSAAMIKIALLMALASVFACSNGSASTSENSTIAKSENKTIQNSAPPPPSPSLPTIEAEKKDSPIATESSPAIDLSTPTNAYKTGYAARKNKDLATLKKVMSKDAIEFMNIFVEPGKTIDDALLKTAETPQAPTDESRNEKIDGDKATLEYPDETGKWRKMDLVKEEGVWKITFAKPKPEDVRIER